MVHHSVPASSDLLNGSVTDYSVPASNDMVNGPFTDHSVLPSSKMLDGSGIRYWRHCTRNLGGSVSYWTQFPSHWTHCDFSQQPFLSRPTTEHCSVPLSRSLGGSTDYWKLSCLYPAILEDRRTTEHDALLSRTRLLGYGGRALIDFQAHCYFTSTETLRTVREGGPGRPHQRSHSSWALKSSSSVLLYVHRDRTDC